MKTKNIIPIILVFVCLQSCGQNRVEKIDLQPKNIYQVTKEDINETIKKYGLKGRLKSVSQKTVYLPKDAVIDISKYKAFDRYNCRFKGRHNG
ncbi:hypothetical protein EA772_20680 [Pedobacter sp. G11]|uniref:hypothetical protein n=1 Tax=Pedobacter sp. G11 TaxID=2482728 RepID=UPI000F5D6893|nr:hypothetical protein [Pedobacter sp. G11]AZI27641.1 hypothetical protein EA772_20680 [Pedobacter sp. G11]